jgi:hypothetical protein
MGDRKQTDPTLAHRIRKVGQGHYIVAISPGIGIKNKVCHLLILPTFIFISL